MTRLNKSIYLLCLYSIKYQMYKFQFKSNIMKKLTLLLIATLIGGIVLSQNSFFKILTSPLKDGSGATIETDNGDILMITDAGSFINKEFIKILKINSCGDTIASRKIAMPEDFYYLSKIFKLDNNQFVAVGGSFNFTPGYMYSVKNKEIFFIFNSNLDSISYKEVLMYENEIPYLSMRDAIMNNNNHIITLCEDMSGRKITLLETNFNGDSIKSSQLQPTYGVNVYSITQKGDFSGYYFSVEGDYNHLNTGYVSNLISIDNDLNYVAIDSLPGECAYYSHLKPFNNSILVGGRAKRIWISNQPPYPLPYITEEYCLEKLDGTLHATKQVFLSHVYQNHMNTSDDTISYPALDQNFDFVDTNNIYTCHYREYPLSIFPNETNYFVVAKFNANLDMKWQYYFGHDAYYSVARIIATTDGGCFINGSRYDAATQLEEYDIFYLKLDSTGILTTPSKSIIPVHSAILYPNPGNDIINVESGPQINGSLLQIFDMEGKPVAEQLINSTLLRLPAQQLPKGIYPWRITLNNKVVDRGKWIKN